MYHLHGVAITSTPEMQMYLLVSRRSLTLVSCLHTDIFQNLHCISLSYSAIFHELTFISTSRVAFD